MILRGEVQIRNDEPNLLCSSIMPVQAVEEEMNRERHHLWLTLVRSGTDEVSISNDIMKVQELRQRLQAHPGRDQYDILVTSGEWEVRLTPGENTVKYTLQLHTALETILGPHSLKVQKLE
ncbi:hypothetical protein [Ktedonospora formicarum]|uniref:Uncharacterized protein n=1 Tax=Ktedonospora formicarum TaxID=2778364 RepID=A0A8J3I4Z3_9CHLR|nr:hypothetical protein [Ktedonospora formicarum]GHO47168.1 hypothetical protein KSX_53310 [Ktedonospora formicarum]